MGSNATENSGASSSYSGWVPSRYGPQRPDRSPFVKELEEPLNAAERAAQL